MSLEEWDSDDPASLLFDQLPADNMGRPPIGALDEDLGSQLGHEPLRCLLIEDRHVVNGLKRGDQSCPVSLRNDRPARSLQSSNGAVAVESDDESIAQSSGLLEQLRVARMQQVKATIREDDTYALCALAT